MLESVLVSFGKPFKTGPARDPAGVIAVAHATAKPALRRRRCGDGLGVPAWRRDDRARTAHQAIRRLHGGGRSFAASRARRDLRLSRPEWGRQDDDDPHDDGSAASRPTGASGSAASTSPSNPSTRSGCPGSCRIGRSSTRSSPRSSCCASARTSTRFPPRVREARLEKLLGIFDLSEWGDELIESFSHGMKQRLAFAAALLHEPQLLVVDEPMVGMDPARRPSVALAAALAWRSAERRSSSRRTASRSPRRCATASASSKPGRLIAIGTLDELRSRAGDAQRLEEVFLKLTGRRRSARRHRGAAGLSGLSLLRPRWLALRGRWQRAERRERRRAALLAGLGSCSGLRSSSSSPAFSRIFKAYRSSAPCSRSGCCRWCCSPSFRSLLFSNVVTALSTYYLSADLGLLLASPISAASLHTGRFFETLWDSSWMIVLFGLPIFLAYGVVHQASPAFYVAVLAVLPPFLVLPCATRRRGHHGARARVPGA